MQRTGTSLALLEHAENLIALGEQRAYIIGATNLLLFVAYASEKLSLAPNLEGAVWTNWPLTFSGLALLFSLLALSPQPLSLSILRDKKTADAMLHFASIGHRDRGQFVHELCNGEEADICEKIARAVHFRSLHARRKFTLLAAATGFTIVQFIPVSIDVLF